LQLRGAGRGLVLLLAASSAGALTALAQDKPTPGDREAGSPAAAVKNRLRLEAVETEVHPEKDETLVVLRGEAHIRFESQIKKDTQFLDIRAENAVAFVPPQEKLEKDGAPSIRALYAEGHVRLSQRASNEPSFVLESSKLWLDLVGERAYAIDAVAHMPGSTHKPAALPPDPRNTPRSAATFTLRAQKLRLEGTSVLTAEGGAISVCDFGLPHEALEATRITIVETGKKKKPPAALAVSAALGDVGGTAIAHRVVRDLPWRAFRDMTRQRAEPNEGSDAIFYATRDPRWVEIDHPSLRVRPPFLDDDGFGFPLPFALDWETDWPFPDVRIGHTSHWGYYEKAELNIPLIHRADFLHDSQDRREKDGLDLSVRGGGGFYEDRGGTGDGSVHWDYYDEGQRTGRGELDGTYVRDRALLDSNGSVIPDEQRYWVHGFIQQDLPLGAHLDAEVSKQSDLNYLLEWDRGAALNEKPQETYVYLRDAWDDLGVRIDASTRLNIFQSQVEDLPRARADWLLTPVFVSPILGGLYFTAGVEEAQLRRRFDDFLSESPLPDQLVVREDLNGELDYKLSLFDRIYLRAWGDGRFTDWNERQILPDDGPGSTEHADIDRFLGEVGARAGTQFDAPFVLTDSGFTIRHVVIPEVGYDDRILDTRDPGTIVQIDQTDTYYPGSYVYARIRNRLQWADNPSGKGAHDLFDWTIEGRYFPTDLRLGPQQKVWGEIYSDARLYLGTEGTLRAVAEIDPNDHTLLRLDTTLTWMFTRSLAKWLGEKDKIYPDVSFSVGYHQLANVTNAIAYGVDARLTESWGVSFQELYDLDQHSFLSHRLTVRRYFHGFAFEVDGSWNPILHDASVSFGVLPFFEGDEPAERLPLDFGGR
jgi:hypothetical protein